MGLYIDRDISLIPAEPCDFSSENLTNLVSSLCEKGVSERDLSKQAIWV